MSKIMPLNMFASRLGEGLSQVAQTLTLRGRLRFLAWAQRGSPAHCPSVCCSNACNDHGTGERRCAESSSSEQ